MGQLFGFPLDVQGLPGQGFGLGLLGQFLFRNRLHFAEEGTDACRGQMTAQHHTAQTEHHHHHNRAHCGQGRTEQFCQRTGQNTARAEGLSVSSHLPERCQTGKIIVMIGQQMAHRAENQRQHTPRGSLQAHPLAALDHQQHGAHHQGHGQNLGTVAQQPVKGAPIPADEEATCLEQVQTAHKADEQQNTGQNAPALCQLLGGLLLGHLLCRRLLCGRLFCRTGGFLGSFCLGIVVFGRLCQISHLKSRSEEWSAVPPQGSTRRTTGSCFSSPAA